MNSIPLISPNLLFNVDDYLESCHTVYAMPYNRQTDFNFALRMMTSIWPHNSRPLSYMGNTIDNARNLLVEAALNSPAKRICWIDIDNVPVRRDGYLTMSQYREPIVTGVYNAKLEHESEDHSHFRFLPCLWKKNGKRYDQIDILNTMKNSNKRFTTCDACGFGFVSTSIDIFTRLDPPWFNFTKDKFTGKGFEKTPDGLGEDFFLCKRIREELGETIYVDTQNKAWHYADAVIDDLGRLRMSTYPPGEDVIRV